MIVTAVVILVVSGLVVAGVIVIGSSSISGSCCDRSSDDAGDWGGGRVSGNCTVALPLCSAMVELVILA